MVLVLPIPAFLIRRFLGMPVAFAMGISGIFGLLLTLGPMATLGLLEIQPFRTAASYTLTTIAMFVLMAEFAAQSGRSEEHTSELQSLMRISYAVFCLKKKKNNAQTFTNEHTTTMTTSII